MVSGFRIGEEDIEDKKEEKEKDVEMEGEGEGEKKKEPTKNLGDAEMMREMFVEYVTGNIGDPSDDDQVSFLFFSPFSTPITIKNNCL